MLYESSDDPLVWKKLYKKQLLGAHKQFAQEDTQDWRIYGQPDARLRIYWNGAQAWRAQGVLYCGARALLALWKDLDFKRRTQWGDLFFSSAHCETVVETFFTQTLGELSVVKCTEGSNEYRLFWTHEDAATSSWTVMSVSCAYRGRPHPPAGDALPVKWTGVCIVKLDDDPQYGPRCYVRLLTWNEPAERYESLVTQMAACETFCRDTARWEALYSPEAMVRRDLELRE